MVGNGLIKRALALAAAVAVLVAGAAWLLVAGGAGAASANSPGADPSDYVAETPVVSVGGAPGELSGVAVNGDGEVFAVDDNGGFVELTESDGAWSGSTVWDPWNRLAGRGLEGLTWIEDHFYAVAFELAPTNSSQSALQIIELRRWGNTQYVRPIGSTIALPNISASSNTGLQGIVYSPAESDASTWVFYAVEEAAPSLWRIEYDVASRTARTSPTGTALAANDLAGVAIPPRDTDSIFVLSDSALEITKFSLPGGQALPAAGSIDVSTFNDPEGLAFFGNTLYVIGEGSEIATFTPGNAVKVALADLTLSGAAATTPGPILIAGTSEALEFTITNTGDVALTNVTITNLGPSSCNSPSNNQLPDRLVDSLAVGETVACAALVPIVDPAVSPVTFDITATAGAQSATVGGEYHYQLPQVAVVLGGIALDGSSAGSAPGPVAEGADASLTFTVQNTSDVDVAVLSTSPASSCVGATLAVNATLTCTSDSPVATVAPVPVRGVTISVAVGGAGQNASDTGAYFYEVMTGTAVINEIKTTGTDWVELYNPSSVAVDLTGWTVTDNNPGGNGNTIPLNITLQSGAYASYETENPPAWDFGFSNGGDSATLRDPNGVVVSTFTWTSPAANSWGLCPDGQGGMEYVDTEGETRDGPNNCTPPPLGPWPGSGSVSLDDVGGTFSAGDLSGLDFAPNGDLWTAIDGGELYRLEENAVGNWTLGDSYTIGYPSSNPSGVVDAEGLTFAGDASTIYVASERDNRPGQNSTSLNTVLSYQLNNAGTPVIDEQWNLTNSAGNAQTLPSTQANDGLEGITWVPDGFLEQNSFFDENLMETYDSASYGPHAGGVFFVAIEDPNAGTNLFGYVLEDDGDFFRVASINVDNIASFMAMEFDAGTGELWAMCDNACNGAMVVLSIDATGRFAEVARFAPPVSGGAPGVLMENLNNEALAIASTSECSGGDRPVFWGEDVNPPNPAPVQSLREGQLTRGC